MRLSNATGNWEKINGRHSITIVDERRFSIPVDTAGWEPFENQKIFLVRGNHDTADLTSTGYSGMARNAGHALPEGAFSVTVPFGYTSTANTMYCRPTRISSFTVSNREATVELAAPLPNDPPALSVGPGREIHFRNLPDARLNSMAYLGQNGKDMPHYITWISDDRKTIKAAVAAEDGSFDVAESNPALLLVCPPNSFNFLFHTRQYGTAYPYPSGRTGNYVKTPPLPDSTNRMYWWVKWGKTIQRKANGGYNASIGTYVKAADDPDPRAERYHFYHYLGPNYYAGQWMRIIINNTPQHHRSINPYAILPNNPTRHGWPYWSAPLWDGRPTDYLASLTSFYIDTDSRSADFSDQEVVLGPITMDTVYGEPDAYVSSITAVWSPDRLRGRDKAPENDNRTPRQPVERSRGRDRGYEIGFATPRQSTDTYEIRYSTKGSLKQLGFSEGEAGGELKGLEVANLIWYSPQMDEQENIWFGIRPKMNILGVSKEGISPIVITTLADPKLDDGDRVTITGVKGNKAANVTNQAITNRPARFWQLDKGLLRIEVYSGEGTVYFAEPHGLVPGQVIEIYGSRDHNLGGHYPNRFYTVHSTPTADTLKIWTEKVPDGVYDQNATTNLLLCVRALPSISITGVGDGSYGGGSCERSRLCSGGGMMVSTDEHKHFTEIHMYPYPAKRRERTAE
jgi:hypothetical protein